MTCGAKYAALVPPKPDFEKWGFGWNLYAERLAAARRLHDLIDAVQTAYPDAADPNLKARLEGYHTRFRDLPATTLTSWKSDRDLILLAQGSAEDGACLLELLEAAVSSKDPAYESVVPAQGAPASSWSWTDALVVGGVVVALGGFTWAVLAWRGRKAEA